MKFYCDVMLGRLSKYLRILGMDCVYFKNNLMLREYQGKFDEQSFFLTKKAGTIKHPHVIIVKSDSVKKQLEEIKNLIKPFVHVKTIMSRCILCNTRLVDIQKQDVEHVVPEFIFHKYELFRVCPTCKKVYWPGSHIEHMQKWTGEFLEHVK